MPQRSIGIIKDKPTESHTRQDIVYGCGILLLFFGVICADWKRVRISLDKAHAARYNDGTNFFLIGKERMI